MFPFPLDQHRFHPGGGESLQADSRTVRRHRSGFVQQAPDGGAASSHLRRGQWVLPLPVEETRQPVCSHQVRTEGEMRSCTIWVKLWFLNSKTFYICFSSLPVSVHCVFSGESGAGKTESTKLLLKFLSMMSKNSAGTPVSERTTRVEQALIQSRYGLTLDLWLLVCLSFNSLHEESRALYILKV